MGSREARRALDRRSPKSASISAIAAGPGAYGSGPRPGTADRAGRTHPDGTAPRCPETEIAGTAPAVNRHAETTAIARRAMHSPETSHPLADRRLPATSRP
ncbi:hypothetical protein GCM10017673_15960 [Streptosporangium violaceochromogenes]|nr:hypothetical protein GCM10017673_15960 [Streptosporangium violaceochromogenes]